MCRREISVLKRMRGRANVVEFLDATVKETRQGVHEVLILTKFYVGGPVLNFMNTRLHLGRSAALFARARLYVCVCLSVCMPLPL